MTSVVKLIQEMDLGDYTLEFKPTMHDFTLIGRIRHWFMRILSWPARSVFKRPKIVHIHFAERLSIWRKFSLLLLWKLARVPVILHSHGAETADLYPEMSRLGRYLFRKGLNCADLIVVLSESWKSFYSQELGIAQENIAIISNPVSIPEIECVKDTEPLLILYSGRIGERKGTFDLIRAWAELDEEGRSAAQLNLCGDGEVDEARELVKSMGIGESCKVLGWVTEEQKADLLQRSSVYVLPSRNEGLPMGILEAMAHRLAVLVTPVGGIPGLITDGQNGKFVPPGDIGAISKALSELISDSGIRSSVASKGFDSVQEFSATKYREKLIGAWNRASGFSYP